MSKNRKIPPVKAERFIILNFSKLKRESNAQVEGLSETDRLLLEKEEEIRRMQEMLKQMQEKLQTDGNKRDSIVNV